MSALPREDAYFPAFEIDGTAVRVFINPEHVESVQGHGSTVSLGVYRKCLIHTVGGGRYIVTGSLDQVLDRLGASLESRRGR